MPDIRPLKHWLSSQPWLPSDYQLSPLPISNINHCFRLQTKQQNWLVKYLQGDEFVLLERHQQFRLQQDLAKYGLAAQPIALSENGCFWVEQWHDLTTLDSLDVDIQQQIPILAQSLAAIHRVTVSVPPLALLQQWQKYFHHLASAARSWQQQAEQLAPLWQRLDKDVLCHHDLAAAHVCLTPQAMILDWEYAAMGNRYFDIASCAIANQLNISQSRQLCYAYASQTGLTPIEVWQQTEPLLPLAKFTADLWFAAAGLE